jgi:hypothetical protein
MTQEGPNRPEPQPLKLDGKTTAIAVLDLSRRCENPQEVCSNLMIPLAEFLDRARQASVPILYTARGSRRAAQATRIRARPLPRRLRQIYGRRA